MEKMIKEEYLDGLIETAIGIDPGAMYHLLNRMGMNSNVNTCGKDAEKMDKVISDVYIDNLIETTIDVDPKAMYQVMKWMKSAPESNDESKDFEQMNMTINEKYIDGLIENTIDIDPEAMYQVMKWMESVPYNNNASKDLEQMGKAINEIYMDDLIETAIGVEPTAMYQLLNKMDSMIEHSERDRVFSACVDEVACGIDLQLKAYFADLPADWERKNQSDLKLKSAIEINSNIILKLLNHMEERIERTERNLAEFRKEEAIYAAI